MTTFKQRLKAELKESINYALVELKNPAPPPFQSDATTGEPINAPDAINPDLKHLFNLNNVEVTQIVANNPDITFGEVTKITGTTSWEPAGETETKTEVTIGIPFLRAIGKLGKMIFGSDGEPAWFQEEWIIANGISNSDVDFENTNQAIVDAPANGTQHDFSHLKWGNP